MIAQNITFIEWEMFAKNCLFNHLVSHWPLAVCCLCLRHDFGVEPTPTVSHRTCCLQHCWSVLRDRKKQTNNKFWIPSGKCGSFDKKKKSGIFESMVCTLWLYWVSRTEVFCDNVIWHYLSVACPEKACSFFLYPSVCAVWVSLLKISHISHHRLRDKSGLG